MTTTTTKPSVKMEKNFSIHVTIIFKTTKGPVSNSINYTIALPSSGVVSSVSPKSRKFQSLV